MADRGSPASILKRPSDVRSPATNALTSSSSNGREDSEDLSLYSKVLKIAKKVLLETKRLSQSQRDEDVVDAAKSTALCTFELSDLIKNYLSAIPQNEFSVSDRYLLESASKVRKSVLTFIEAFRQNQANPYDYLLKQEVENSSKEVVAAIKQVVSAAESTDEQEEEDEEPKFTYDIVGDVKKATSSLNAVFASVKDKSESKFPVTSKELVMAVNQLIKISAELDVKMEEPLKEQTFAFISAGRVSLANGNEEVFYKQFENAKTKMSETIKNFLFACNKQSRLKRSSWMMVIQGTKDEEITAEEKLNRETAQKIISILGEHFRGFRDEWAKAKPEVSESALRNVSEELKGYLSESSKEKERSDSLNNSFVLEGDAMKDLQRIMMMSSTNDWPSVSKELKSFTERVSGRRDTVAASEVLKAPSGAAASSNITRGKAPIGSDTNLEKAFGESWIACSDSATQLLIAANRSLGVMNAESSETMKGAVTSFLESLGTIFQLAKLAASSMAKDSGTIQKTPSSRGLTESVDVNNGAKITSLLEGSVSAILKQIGEMGPKGRVESEIVEFITQNQGTGTAENFLSTKVKMEENLQVKTAEDSTAFRHLLSRLHALLTAMTVESKRKDSKNVFQLVATGKSILQCLTNLLNSLETFHFLHKSKTLIGAKSPSNQDEARLRSQTVVGNAGLPSNPIMGTQGEFMGGTLDTLIKHLTTVQDASFMKSFILTLQSFTTPWVVLDKLQQRYESRMTDENGQLRVKLRVCVVLKYWIENQFHDFDENLLPKLSNFIQQTIRKDPQTQMGEMSKRLESEMAKKMEERKVQRVAIEVAEPITIGAGMQSPAEMFLNFNETDIAKQLTLVEFRIYSRIQPSELLNQAWNKPQLKHRSPNILSLISRSNKISFGVASLILWHAQPAERAKTIEKWIRIATNLRDLNNFNSLIAIIAGLNTSAVSRLKQTWDLVGKVPKENLQKYQGIFDPSNSSKIYRAARNEATSKGPTMPYIGTTLSDLTFAEDGNPDNLQDNKNLINFAKRELICKLVMDFQLNQHPTYNIQPSEPVYTLIAEMPFTEDKELYDLSLIREPRERTQGQK